MNYVKQAYALDGNEKEVAKNIYKDAVEEFVNKNYKRRTYDAHTELSAIFGEMWVYRQIGDDGAKLSYELMAEANVAFNYANFTLGISGRFTEYAKELVAKANRVSDKELAAMTKQMNCMLTATTAEKFCY